MNYITLLPNYYQSFNSTLPISCIQPQQKISSVLPILAHALKFSISQYSVNYQLQKPEIQSKGQNHREKTGLQRQQVTQRFEQEEKIEIAYNLKGQVKENTNQNIEKISVSGEKVNQNFTQTVTNDQILSQNLLSPPQKEYDDFSVLNKKQKIRPKGDIFHVAIPQIDLIQTIEPSAFHLSKEEMRKRKEGLMLRQVVNWNQKMKNRRGKREVRMLNN